MEYHEYANAFPMMSTFEMKELVKSVRENGLRYAIVMYDGKILDGRNRFEACREAGITPEFKDFVGTNEEAFEYVKDSNLNRRNMSDEQRAFSAAKLAKLKPGTNQNEAKLNSEPVPPNGRDRVTSKTIAELSKELKVSPKSTERARAVLASGISTLEGAVVDGKVSMKAAEQIAKLNPGNQSRAINEGWTADRAKTCRERESMNASQKPASLVSRDESAEPMKIEGLEKMNDAMDDAEAALVDALRLARTARNFRKICIEVDEKWENKILPLIRKIGALE